MLRGLEIYSQQDSTMVVTDQKVPQGIYSPDSEIYTQEYNIPNILGLEDFSELEPVVPATICDSNNDQRVYETESPKSFVDLDNINGHGISFYDESASLNIKPEKDVEHASYNCVMHDIDSYPMYQSTHLMVKDEPVEDLVIRQVKEDIDNTCNILRISPNPMYWTMEDVRKWFVWHSQQYGVPSDIYESFLVTGEQLCIMTDEDFKARSPEAGSNFYGQLDVWKTACNYETECQPSPVQHQIPYYDNSAIYYDHTAYDVNYSPAATSPVPSEDSIDSTTSSNISYIQACHEDDYTSYTQSSLPVEHDHKQTIHLWQFLKDLLLRPDRYNSCIKWIDRQRGIFKIEDSTKVAKLWGMRKNRPAMNYDKLSRSIRQYYKKGIIKKTEHSKRLVYQFCQPYL